MSQTAETALDDLQAERSVLGAVFLKPEVLDDLLFLEARDFYSKKNELIFGVMRYLHGKDIPIDLLTVTEHFQRRGRYDDMGGVAYIAELAQSCPTAENALYHARIVRSKAHRRRGIEAARDIVEIATGGDYTVQLVPNSSLKNKPAEFESDEDYFAAVEERVFDIRPQNTSKMRSFADMRKDYFDHLKSKAAKLLTGVFKQFDEWAMIWMGWLYIIAGRPGVGKTAKALQLAYGICKHNASAGPVLFFSQEMDETELIDRMVAMSAGVNYNRLINKGGPEGFTETEWKRINDAYDEIERFPLYVQDSAGVTIDEIRATARQFKKRYGKIAAIIVDYLQIMEIPLRGKNENRAQAIGRVTRTAKTMARNMKFCFIMLSQLDREVDDGEPKLRHLKESGSIEQDADVVEFLYHGGDYENGAKVIQSIFAKGRNVGQNRFRLKFEWWLQRYVELEKKGGDDGGKTGAPNRGAGGKGGGSKKGA
ncbi:replicative DNA helicase [Paenibacillus sp. UNCCL117]|uniref:replicative DNA helicase n=1 Tax=unclassified Paenibacillus TaxID=185978 RepID=UPI00088AA990|nr:MULTISPECIES: DnaB-like helicase C-terminal domain-containing protein [unclassified Paenibacillus]SDD28289.1 replicative DNA helicase [Paenibacillus sp. cl123]SFW40935.1 replicative DNA helicase [Paenibacillus sp. UNCCL117]